jgi:hypothetical protein
MSTIGNLSLPKALRISGGSRKIWLGRAWIDLAVCIDLLPLHNGQLLQIATANEGFSRSLGLEGKFRLIDQSLSAIANNA